MKVTIVETKESDGDWIKVFVDEKPYACIGFGEGRIKTREQAFTRANEIAVFCFENGGTQKILKELMIISHQSNQWQSGQDRN
jgi:hypothetical protein